MKSDAKELVKVGDLIEGREVVAVRVILHSPDSQEFRSFQARFWVKAKKQGRYFQGHQYRNTGNCTLSDFATYEELPFEGTRFYCATECVFVNDPSVAV